MKKIFLYILAGTLALTSCKKDDEIETYKEPEDIAVQNDYDDQAIQKFLENNYLDTNGSIKAFSTTETSDDDYTKLKDLPGLSKIDNLGVYYYIRPNAQPTIPNPIIATDSLAIMMRGKMYVGMSTDGVANFSDAVDFSNTIDGSGSPIMGPKFFNINPTDPLIVNASTDAAKQKSYYEIEGFKEALQKFDAFNLSNDAPYNFQGFIIVPSRSAFARDPYYAGYSSYSLRNRSFVFNFQVYRKLQ